MAWRSVHGLTLVVCLGLACCGKKEDTATPSTEAGGGGAPSEAAMAEAREIFATRCTPCHGPTGAGDGPASAGLTPKPANFQQPEWQKRVTDEHIEKIIQFGGAAVGRSPAMPGNPDLISKPEVIRALRQHIRSLEK